MWTVTMKRRDIWTWSNCWRRRNHGWWVGQLESCRGCLRSRWNKVLPFSFSQEYETTRKEIESVKKEREEAKKNLSALKHSQAPMVRKIKEIDEQLQPTEDQVKFKVKAKREILLKVSTLAGCFFPPQFCFILTVIIVLHSIISVSNDECLHVIRINIWNGYIILIILSFFADGCHQGRHSEVQTDAGSAWSKGQRGTSTFQFKWRKCFLNIQSPVSFK